MDFTKISFTPGKPATSDKGKDRPPKTRLEWLQPVIRRLPDGGKKMHVDERSLVSSDAPHPDFLRALQGLRTAVMDACMIPDEGYLDGSVYDAITVRSVTLKRIGSDAIPGVAITALRELDWSDSPLVLNTPFQPIALVPTDDLDELLEALAEEAREFIGGKRAQGSLFDPLRPMRDMVNREDSGVTKVSMIHDGKETVLAEREA